MTETTKAEAPPKKAKARLGARVLETGEGFAIVERDEALMTGFRKLNGEKLHKIARGCRACMEALFNLKGEPPLTPREIKHGVRVLRVTKRVGPKGVRLHTFCGTCGHRLKRFTQEEIDPAFWDALDVKNMVPA